VACREGWSAWLAVLESIRIRLPIPTPGLWLLAAALVPGSVLGTHTVEWIAVAALVVILLDGGMDIGWARMRRSLNPVVALGVLGTLLTAALLALVAHAVLGLDWKLAGIVGAALAPTDPAVVFSVLGGTEIRGRAGTILEGEAGFNDPAGIALMLGMIHLATHPDATPLTVVSEFGIQMGIGLLLGFLGARVLVRLHHPILLLAGAAALYGVTTLAHGSGFLAVFVAGLVVGEDTPPPPRQVASAAEIVVFVALGLTIAISDIPWNAWRDGAVLIVVLAFAVRPVVVAVTLARARLQPGDRIFIAWSGLKGAVPILLAAFAVLHGVKGAGDVYAIVFVAVVLSVFGQGSLVPLVARRVLRP
jgi:potassium/hydrogen antiporter